MEALGERIIGGSWRPYNWRPLEALQLEAHGGLIIAGRSESFVPCLSFVLYLGSLGQLNAAYEALQRGATLEQHVLKLAVTPRH